MNPLPGVSRELYPFDSRIHVLPDGHRMHYLDEGPADGQPVVMVHGNPTWSFYYREPVKALRERFRCLVPDHVGMGLSDRPGDDVYDYTLASRVRDLGHWLDAVEPDRPVDLVVHDWGGAIALTWAVAHPQRVCCSTPGSIPDPSDLPRSLAFARTRPGAFLIGRFNAFAAMAARVATRRRLAKSVARGLVAPYRGGPQRRLATLRFVQDIPLRESDPAWPVLADTEQRLEVLADKPALICWGGKDFVFNDRVLARWREVFPDARVEYLADAGHYVLEDAASRIVPLIRNHLS